MGTPLAADLPGILPGGPGRRRTRVGDMELADDREFGDLIIEDVLGETSKRSTGR